MALCRMNDDHGTRFSRLNSDWWRRGKGRAKVNESESGGATCEEEAPPPVAGTLRDLLKNGAFTFSTSPSFITLCK